MIKRVFVLIGDRNFRTDVFKVLKNWYKDSVLDLIWMKIDKTQYFNFKTYLRRDRYDAFLIELDEKFDDFEVITNYSRSNGYIPILLQETDNKNIEKLFDKSSIHYRTILNYENDDAIVRMINDTQGRVKDMIKNIYKVFDQVRRQGSRIKSTTMLFEYEGDVVLRDKTKGLQIYTQYMHSIVGDKSSFIKQDILSVIETVIPTAPPKLVEQTLEWCSNNHKYIAKDLVHQLIDKTLLHSFNYLENNRNVYRGGGDLPQLVTKLKGIYSSSRSTDPLLKEIRQLAENIVKKTKLTKSSTTIAAVRSAVLLYIVIRAFTMTHFSRTG